MGLFISSFLFRGEEVGLGGQRPRLFNGGCLGAGPRPLYTGLQKLLVPEIGPGLLPPRFDSRGARNLHASIPFRVAGPEALGILEIWRIVEIARSPEIPEKS